LTTLRSEGAASPPRRWLRARAPRQVSELARYCIGGLRRRIPEGPNQGLVWSVVSSGRGYGRGTFEPARAETIASLIQAGDCFWDIGAHKGYVALIAARRVGEAGRVYAFEPSRSNLWFLRKHLEWNRADNVQVVAAALSSYDGVAHFGGGSSLALKLGVGCESVVVRAIQSLLVGRECQPPTFLKIDVEGAEADVLMGAASCLEQPDLALLVSIHSRQQYDRCAALLDQHGYRLINSGALSRALSSDWHDSAFSDGRGDPDLLALRPSRQVARAVLDRFSAADQ
jgi:FkbM family methyltransferase